MEEIKDKKGGNGQIDPDQDQLQNTKHSPGGRRQDLCMQEPITLEQIFENFRSKAPDFIPRKKFYELTGGTVAEKTLANLDSKGRGIQPRMRIGGKVVYPKDAAIAWIKNRCELI